MLLQILRHGTRLSFYCFSSLKDIIQLFYCTIVLHSLVVCQLSIIYVYLSCDNGSYRELCCLRSGRDWAVVGTSSDIPTPRQHDTRTATAWQQERDIRRPDNTSRLEMSRRHTRSQHIYLLMY